MNQLFQQFGQLQQTSNNNFMERFMQFKNNFQGNPQQIVQQMLNSGRITQEQYNKAVQTAQQMMRYFK